MTMLSPRLFWRVGEQRAFARSSMLYEGVGVQDDELPSAKWNRTVFALLNDKHHREGQAMSAIMEE